MSRSNMDFSKHTHRIEIFKSADGNEIRVDHLQVGDSRMNYIKFINEEDIMSVTGDFGNWIFCRPFIPSKKGKVIDHYWTEKLKISSIQSFDQLDFDLIIQDIKEKIDVGLEEYGYGGDKLEQAQEWYRELLEVAKEHDIIRYEMKAYRDYYKPDFIEYDSIPYYKVFPTHLKVILDAFDEICRRLKDVDNET